MPFFLWVKNKRQRHKVSLYFIFLWISTQKKMFLFSSRKKMCTYYPHYSKMAFLKSFPRYTFSILCRCPYIQKLTLTNLWIVWNVLTYPISLISMSKKYIKKIISERQKLQQPECVCDIAIVLKRINHNWKKIFPSFWKMSVFMQTQNSFFFFTF